MLSGMGLDSEKLTRKQLRKLQGSIRPMVKYLEALELRMTVTGFPTTDPLYHKVKIAKEATSGLLHYTGYIESLYGE
jgi:hypothetical protein